MKRDLAQQQIELHDIKLATKPPCKPPGSPAHVRRASSATSLPAVST